MGLFGFGKTSVHISRSVYEEILRHAKEAYPNECCGVLVGANTDRAHDRYIIDPKEFNLIDKMARSCSMDVMGFYHSHPDHPDKPSETDREWGQTGYSYIIVSVKGGKDTSARSWMIEEDTSPFTEEKIKILENQ